MPTSEQKNNRAFSIIILYSQSIEQISAHLLNTRLVSFLHGHITDKSLQPYVMARKQTVSRRRLL